MGNAKLVYGTVITLKKLLKLLNDLQTTFPKFKQCEDELNELDYDELDYDEFDVCNIINTLDLGFYVIRRGACCNSVSNQFILLAQHEDNFTTLTRGDASVKAKLSNKLKKETKELFKKLQLPTQPCMYLVSYDCDSCT